MSETEQGFDPSNLNETKTPRAQRTETTNEAGGRAWSPDDVRFGLYKNIINNLLEDSYYQTAGEQFDDVVEEFIDVVESGEYEYPFQLATYARHEGGYRDIAQVLLVLGANWGKRQLSIDSPTTSYQWSTEWSDTDGPSPTQEYVADYAPMVIDRMDEFNTVVSLQIELFGKPIPRPLRQGITDALHKKYAILKVDGTPFDDDPTARVTFIDDGSGEIPRSASSRAVHRVYDQNDVQMNVENYGVTVVDEGYVFDDYTAAKYMQTNHDVSLQDVINLVRPAPRSDNRDDLFERLTYGEPEMDEYDVEPLRNERTWESERSSDTTIEEFTADTSSSVRRGAFNVDIEFTGATGNVVHVDVDLYDSDSEVVNVDKEITDDGVVVTVEAELTESDEWRHRLDDMGLMARVRNLRNMLEAGLLGREIFDYDSKSYPDHDYVFGSESRSRVQEHQMFPHRYYQGFKAVADIGGFRGSSNGFEIRSDLMDSWTDEWLNQAIDASIENLPDEFDSTFTAIDLSGSMNGSVSNKSELVRAEIATLFGSVVTKYGGDVGAFGEHFQTVDVDDQARRNMGTLDLAREIYQLNDAVGNRTNGWKALKWAVKNEEVYDRFVFFTDEQIWDSARRSSRSLKEFWDQYLDEVNPNAHLYVVDLASYGDLSMPQDYHNVHQISGWNSDVIEFIDKNEKAQDVISDIGSIKPGDY